MKEINNFINYIRFYSSYLPSLGLYNGKVGCLLAMYLHGKKHNDSMCLQTCDWLMEDIMDNINESLPLNMENGLIGIAMGITILQSYGGLPVDLNDVLYDIDKNIMRYDPRRIEDTSFRMGLLGITSYIEQRMNCGIISSIDSQYIEEIKTRCTYYNITPYNSIKKSPLSQLIDDLTPPDFIPSDYEHKPISLSSGSSYFLLQSSIS